MDSTPPTHICKPCDVWDKISKPTQFNTVLARLIVWFIFPIYCMYCIYFLRRLLSWRTSNLFAVAIYGALVVHAPYVAWSYELRHNPYACVCTVNKLPVEQEISLLEENRAYVRWYGAHMWPSWRASKAEGSYNQQLF